MGTVEKHTLILREIRFRAGNFLLSTISVAIVCSALTVSFAVNQQSETRIRSQALAKKESLEQKLMAYDASLQQALRRLGFDLTIVPENADLTDFYASSYGSHTMPAQYLDRLVNARLMSIDALQPILQQKVEWEERNWTVLLAGYGDARLKKTDQAGFDVPKICTGVVDVGWEIHQSLGLHAGQDLLLNGMRFTIDQCLPEAGTKEDVTIRANLKDVQKLLQLPDQLSEIRAMGCRWVRNEIDNIRKEIVDVIPGIRVIEQKTKALARAEARAAMEKTGLATIREETNAMRHTLRRQQNLAVAVILLLCCIIWPWTVMLATANVRARRIEIGLLQAIGHTTRDVQTLFLYRAFLIAFTGAMMAVPIAFLLSGSSTGGKQLATWLVMDLLLAGAMMGSAGWWAGQRVAKEDSADILKMSP